MGKFGEGECSMLVKQDIDQSKKKNKLLYFTITNAYEALHYILFQH